MCKAHIRGLDSQTGSNARTAQGGAIIRMVEPEEVAELAIFFASAPGGTTTGQSASVCGGFKMH
jgi:NAD(P)-dependent dehydrogenase (short-subunit alcohol dehydrogenase family)